MTHRPRRWAASALVVVAALVVAACGVPLDEEPRAISRTTLPTSPTTATPTTVDGATAEVSVYFLREERLERVDYPTDGPPSLSQAIGFVLEPPAEELADGLRTAIPPGTTLRTVDISGNIATIDLTPEIADVSGLVQKEAFAQIVFTALAIEQVEQVQFLVDGRVIDAPTDEGNVSLVSADDFDRPLNPR